MIGYKDLFIDSTIMESNNYFTLYQNDAFPLSFDRNMMKLHFNPLLAEFKLMETYQKEIHQLNDQHFIKFYWPQDQGLYPEIFNYFADEDYMLGKTSLLTIFPQHFIARNDFHNDNICIEKVNDKNLADYLALNWVDDSTYGQDFAEQKQDYLHLLIADGRIEPIIAYYDGKAVGCLNKKIYPKFFEIDEAYVLSEYRYKGVATVMQRAVMQEAMATDRFVALLADTEDTPFKMYIRQGYEVVASQITVHKKFAD